MNIFIHYVAGWAGISRAFMPLQNNNNNKREEKSLQTGARKIYVAPSFAQTAL